jgi:hypothetical protein
MYLTQIPAVGDDESDDCQNHVKRERGEEENKGDAV